MGKIGKTLFGSPGENSSSSESQSHSESGNLAYPGLNTALSPSLGYVSQGGNLVANLLGAGGGPAQTSALNNFANSGGMQFLMDQGQKAITSSKAAQGLLRSGSYGTALAKYGQGLASTYLNQYINNALELGKLGLGSASVLANAGQWSKSDSTSSSESEGTGAKQGIAGDLMKAAGSIAASDRRLKTNVVEVGRDSNGLMWYQFDYIPMKGLPRNRQVGVMADEVQKIKPEAYVPNFFGEYAGVDYGKLD